MAKSVLVTGGARGIGLAIVQKLSAEGWRVAAMGRASAEAAVPRLEGTDALYIQGDVSDAAARERAVMTCAEAFGRLDALVNVAGIAPRQRNDLLDMTEESFDEVIGVNLKGTLFLSQLAARLMLRQEPVEGRRGVIVNVASVSSYASSVNRGEYCISKAGVSMVTRLLADRLAEEAVPVFEVRPGIIATDMTAGVAEKYDRRIADGLLPIARWGRPEDVANAVNVLCSGGLTYCTGEVINVDGGFHIPRL